MSDKKDRFVKRPLLPGYVTGLYEQKPSFDREELSSSAAPMAQKKVENPEDEPRRGNHVNIRLSDADLSELHRMALLEGVPTKSFIASIVHQYVKGELAESHDMFMRRFGPEPVINGPSWVRTGK